MIEFAGLVLGEVAKAFLGALAGKITDEVWSKLKGDPAHHVLKQALGAAIQEYAGKNLRLDLIRPLLQQKSLLAEPDVAQELTQIVRFQREPNYDLIGQRWKAYLDDPPQYWDFTFEAKLLVEYLRTELRSTEAFRPVFDSKDLRAIAVSAVASTESLAHMEAQLADLAQLMDSRFSELIRTFAGASPDLREQIRDYTLIIEDKTRGFVGRQFIFDEIERFIESEKRGYFLIHSYPGVGKTALAAQLVKTKGYVHHFNSRAQGITKATLFLKNTCAQLIAGYQLGYTSLPERAGQDSGYLLELLNEISHRLPMNERVVIVVDALDEVDDTGANVLDLPETLPQGVYIVATMRTSAKVTLHIECEQHPPLYLDPGSKENEADIREHLKQALMRPGIQRYIDSQGINNEDFVELLSKKSQGNFMYLHYVLPAIEGGLYKDRKLQELPTGLQGYYERHWQYMRGKDTEAWFKYKLPILRVLAAVKEPVSIDMIEKFSGVRERERIIAALQKEEWGQFLQIEGTSSKDRRYSLYHASFRDFLSKKDEVEVEVRLIEGDENIANFFISKLRGDGDEQLC